MTGHLVRGKIGTATCRPNGNLRARDLALRGRDREISSWSSISSRESARPRNTANIVVAADEVIDEASRTSRLSSARAAVVCSRTRAVALPTDRPICNARVPRAIGQSFDWFVPAEAEVLGARVADRPAAFPLAELEQRASASVVDRDVFSRRLRPPERHHQHLMLGEDVQARTL